MFRIRHFAALAVTAAFLGLAALMMAPLANAAESAEARIESAIGAHVGAQDRDAAARDLLQLAQQNARAQCMSRCADQFRNCTSRCTGPTVDSQGRPNRCLGRCSSQRSSCVNACPPPPRPQRPSTPGRGAPR
jgi:hypothetical protein